MFVGVGGTKTLLFSTKESGQAIIEFAHANHWINAFDTEDE